MPELYKCNLVVPGFAKCGTSSFHAYLGQHPEIAMSSMKEPHFFSFEERFALGPARHNQLFDNRSPQTEVFGEASTSYCVWEPALHRIKASLDQPKLIVLLRHPIDRLLSHYRWMFRIGHEKQRIGDSIRLELAQEYDITVNRGGCYPWYIRHSRYSQFCPMMLDLFGAENVLLLRTDDLARTPEKVFDRVFAFLAVPPHRIDTRDAHNVTARQPPLISPAIERTYANLPAAAKKLIRFSGIGKIATFAFTSTFTAPRPRDDEMRMINRELRGDVEFYLRESESVTRAGS